MQTRVYYNPYTRLHGFLLLSVCTRSNTQWSREHIGRAKKVTPRKNFISLKL